MLEAIRGMPQGGGYAASSTATQRLIAAASISGSALSINADGAVPSYCSSATYLVFLKAIERLQREGGLSLEAGVMKKLLPAALADGVGVWGRWNANGPGTARLFFELGIGVSFVGVKNARAGDFMKIFWKKDVGAKESGHSVVFLGTELVSGVEHIRFWSSNQSGGYGEKSVTASSVVNAIFSRFQYPSKLSSVLSLREKDPYLSSLLTVESSFDEAKRMSGI